ADADPAAARRGAPRAERASGDEGRPRTDAAAGTRVGPRADAAAATRAYRERVPAVARAVQALEYLASAPRPTSLAALSKALGVGPSSLLAILTTLRHRGLVSRSSRDGRYLPGPGLVALGTAAAQCLEPLQTFDLLASDLVEQLGE